MASRSLSLAQRSLAAGAALLLAVAGGAATAQDEPQPPPNQQEPFQEPPLPPELAPDLFVVDQLTAAYLWPRPWNRFIFRRPSGYIPPPCRNLVSLPSGAVLDCWLAHHPTIADAIKWDFTGGGDTRWRFWNAVHRADLRAAFRAARQWAEAGFAGPWPGDPFEEPPINREEPFYPTEDEISPTVLDTAAAWSRFLAQVAISLAAEIDAWVPWSLRDYHPRALEDLFNAALWQYTLDRDDGGAFDSVYHGHIVKELTPAHPATVFRFLLEEGILGPTPRATIGRLLGWSRDHMRHAFAVLLPDGTRAPAGREYEAFWHYRGLPPVVRILEGTDVFDPELGPLAFVTAGWTTGCTGTTRFLRAVLRVVNIPVREIVSPRTCGHAIPYFAGEGLYLSHGDDPYTTFFKTGDFRAEELLVSTDTWNRWFPVGDEETSCQSVGRRVLDLNVERPSGALVAVHCGDLLAGRSHADSEVLAAMRGLYTVEELERRGFWSRLDALAETSAAPECVAWRSG